MKFIGRFLKTTLLLAALTGGFVACNKEDLGAKKALHVLVNGYNGSVDELEVWIDTVQYSKDVSNAKYSIKPGELVNFNVVYSYRTAQPEGELIIKEPVSGRILFNKPLPANSTKANYNFVYIDGKLQDLIPPAADAAANKLGFYLQYTKSADPVDIFLYRVDNTTGQEYRQHIARAVKPGSWVYVDYQASESFRTQSILRSSHLCFTRAGTTDQWAFDDSEGMSKLDASSLLLPEAGEKGLVQPYFLKPGQWQLEAARLFFYPDRS